RGTVCLSGGTNPLAAARRPRTGSVGRADVPELVVGEEERHAVSLVIAVVLVSRDRKPIVDGRLAVFRLELEEVVAHPAHRRAGTSGRIVLTAGDDRLELPEPPPRLRRVVGGLARSAGGRRDQRGGEQDRRRRGCPLHFLSPPNARRSISSRARSTIPRTDRRSSTETVRPSLNIVRPRAEKDWPSWRSSSATAGPDGSAGFAGVLSSCMGVSSRPFPTARSLPDADPVFHDHVHALRKIHVLQDIAA